MFANRYYELYNISDELVISSTEEESETKIKYDVISKQLDNEWFTGKNRQLTFFTGKIKEYSIYENIKTVKDVFLKSNR